MDSNINKNNKLVHIDSLFSNPLFDKFDKNTLEGFINSIEHKIINLKKDDTLFYEEDYFPYLCILLDGEILLSKSDESGNRNIIDIVKSGQMFAEAFSFTTEKISPVTAQAFKNCTVLLLDTDRLLRIENNDIETTANKYQLISNLLGIFANKNLILLSKIEIISRRNTREKILHYLEMQKEVNQSKIFTIPYSRKEMADFLGVDRSALSRELGKLKEENIIDFDKNVFKIL